MDLPENDLFRSLYQHLDQHMVLIGVDPENYRFRFFALYGGARLLVNLNGNENCTALHLDALYPVFAPKKHHAALLEKFAAHNVRHFLGNLQLDTSDGEIAAIWSSPMEEAQALSDEACQHLVGMVLDTVCSGGRQMLELEYGLPQAVQDEIRLLTDTPPAGKE